MKKQLLQLTAGALFLAAGSNSLFAQLNFNANVTNGCKPLTVVFNNNTTDPNAYRYEWNFWDGSPILVDTMPVSVTHTFTSPGNYPVRVDVYNSSGGFIGSTQGSSGSIQVNGITFYPPDSICLGDQVNFCPNNMTYSTSWNFGDGNTSTQTCNLHGYASLGTYTVTLVANGPSCGTETISRPIVVANSCFPHPNAWINGIQNNTACNNQPLNFGVSDSYSSYSWNFGDGATSGLKQPVHTYTATGVYNYSLTVVNGCGKSGTYTNSVAISNTVPFPNNIGIGTPTQACPGQQGNIYLYGIMQGQFPKVVWNFGDGSPKDSSGTSVNHTYGSAATYTISCRIYSYCGNDTVITKAFNVTNYAPFPNNTQISANPAVACPNSFVNLNASWGYVSYQWNFGDGSPIQTTNDNYTEHKYGSTLTTYTATVKITNSCGNDTTVKTTVTISNTAHFPTQNFYVSGNSPSCPNSNVGFNAPGGYASYQWNFGDGSPLTTTTDNWSNHTYGNTLTTYTATVKITNNCGLDTTIATTILISNTVTFPAQSWFKLESQSPVCPNSSAYFNAPNGYSTYQWNFGDGSPVQTTSGNNNPNYINHTYGSTITTYTASVKITNGCGHDTTMYSTVQISNTAPFPNQSWFKMNINTTPACPNTDVGFNVQGGFTSYEWNFGDGSPSFTTTKNDVNHIYGSTLTTYTASVKITNGCGNDTTLYGTIQITGNVPWPTQSWFKLEAQPSPACPNDQVGFNAPGGYINYVWSFGDGDTASGSRNNVGHTYTAVGTYTAALTITNGCGNDTTLYTLVTISNSGTFSNWLNIEMTPSSASCPNDIIEFRFNPEGYSSYFWNFGDGDTVTTLGSSIQHSYTATGTYTVSCKVKNGCGNTTTIYSTVLISNTAAVSSDLGLKGIQNPACKDDVVFFIPNGGQPTYSYVWNFGDGSAPDTTIGSGTSHSYTATGSYTVTAVVTNGCGSTATVSVTEVISNSAVPLLVEPDGEKLWGFPGGENGNGTAGCAGDAVIFYFMGSATSNMWHFGDGDSGTATEHMLVYGGDGSFPVTVIKHAYDTNGTYKVYLTLTNGCGNSVTDTMMVTIGGNLLVDGDMTTSPPPFSTCAAIDFIAFGGTDYKWNFGDGTTLNTPSPTVSHTYATQGIYVATVLVTNGCGNSTTFSRSVNVSGAGGPSVSVASNTPPTCVGGGNGSAAVSVTNGIPPYLYSWSTGQTTSSASNLAAGLYYATVTDNIGCSSTLGVNVNDPAAIVLSGSSTNASCGASDGTASVSVTSGGTPAYQYAWSNGETTSTVSGFGVGSYSVLVTDANGCTSTKNVSVSEANGASLSVNTITNVSCSGGNNGSVSMNISGGTPPYTYTWSNGATTQNITGLTAGNYSVLVTDNSACKATLNATVSQPTAIVVTASVVKDPTCGNFDGTASASATGGTGPYTYLWDPGAGSETTQQVDSLPAGSYSVTVTDSQGCSQTGVVSLSNSNSPNLSAVVTDVSCNGGNNGSIDLTVTGGTSPYLYTWSTNPPNLQDVSNLVPGNYFVSVVDKKGCQSFRIYTVSQPAVLTVSVSNTGATCGNNDGMATATPSGGNTPYTYLWTGGQTTQTATGLTLGSKTVTITDKKGCTTTATTTVSATTTVVDICMVTVDTTSTKNLIVWEKPVVSNIDSFFVYREIASVFTYIGGLAYSDQSMFTDNTNGVNPNITAYRYKIATKDNCGGISAKSAPHRTINLSVNPKSPCGYTLFWNDYSGFPVTQYRIWRDSAGKGWKAVDSVSFGTTQWADINCYTVLDTIRYRVEIDHPTGCVASIMDPSPDATNLNSSKSNIYRTSDSTLTAVPFRNDELLIGMYPNPTSGMFVVDLRNNSGPAAVKVYNMLGEEIKQVTSNGRTRVTVDLSKQSKGVYFIQVSSAGKLTTQKIIIE